MPLKDGEMLTLVPEGNWKEGTLYIKYDCFAKDVKPGEQVLIDDGKMYSVLLKPTEPIP